jgi:hypothetical protein
MLTDLKARQAKMTGKSYAIADFDGLYLNVSATGFKAWLNRPVNRGGSKL